MECFKPQIKKKYDQYFRRKQRVEKRERVFGGGKKLLDVEPIA